MMKKKKWAQALATLCLGCLAITFIGCSYIQLGGISESVDSSESSKSETAIADIDEGATAGLQYQKISGAEEYRLVGIGDTLDADIVISSTYKGLPVTEIAARAFAVTDSSAIQNYYIESVTVPDSITKIDRDAFSKCDNLIRATISGGELCEGAFYQCKNLASVTLGENVTKIGKSAFSGCAALVRVNIPNSATEIGDYAFYGCALTEVIIGDNVERIGKSAFQHCERLTYVKIGSGVKSIGEGAFWYCVDLVNLEIESGSIGDYAFCDCDSLVNVTFGEGVTEIGYSAFEFCRLLQSVVLSDSIKVIKSQAFRSCSALSSLTIGAGVTDIESEAVCYCSSLTNVQFNGTIEEWNKINNLGWAYSLATKTVLCLDGEVSIEFTH